RDVVRELMQRRDEVMRWVARAGNVAQAIDELSRALGVDPKDGIDKVEHALIEETGLPSSEWATIAALCEQGGKTDGERGAQFRAAFAASGPTRIQAYLSIFLTDKMEPRKNVITLGLAKKQPDLDERLRQTQGRVCALLERRNAVIGRDRTAALLTIGA